MDVNDILGKSGSQLVAARAFGAPMERDGATIIPVAVVAGGGGGGQGSDEGTTHGEGGGFGGLVYPIGVYVVRGDSVRFVPSVNVTRIVVGAVALLRLAVRSRVKVAAVRGYDSTRASKARKGN